MNKYKILGLTFLLALGVSTSAQQQQSSLAGSNSRIVMTKAELKSFLKMIAEKRITQLRNMDSLDNQKIDVKYIGVNSSINTNGKSIQPTKHSCKMACSMKSHTSSKKDLSYEIQRINQRLDNLMLALIGRRGTDLELTLPKENLQSGSIDSTEQRIAALQNQIASLKSENKSNDDARVKALEEAVLALKNVRENFDNKELVGLQNELEALKNQRADNTKIYITPERRSVLQELLSKYKNFKRQVFFANNSFTVGKGDLDYINNVVRVLKQNPELSVVLEGYASTVGSPIYNKQLSMQRAEAVASIITNKGISSSRIISAFKGEDKGVLPEKARRVDMTVVIK